MTPKITALPEPVVLLDRREQAPPPIKAYRVEWVTLPVGEIGIKGFSDWVNPAFIIERKSLADLTGSLGRGRERFMREIEKLKQFGFRALVIEATKAQVAAGAYRSTISPASVLSTLDALAVRANLHLFWCEDSEGCARQVESLVRQFARGIERLHGTLLKPKHQYGQEIT